MQAVDPEFAQSLGGFDPAIQYLGLEDFHFVLGKEIGKFFTDLIAK